MIRLAFWALVVLDLLGILLWFLLGLAAAGSARTSPFQVAFLLLVLPGICIALAILLFLRAPGPGWRAVGFLLAAAPLLLLVGSRVAAEAQFRGGLNAAGQQTFFRSGPRREIAEAIARNDAATVTALAPGVDLDAQGAAGMTLLAIAMRQLRTAPERIEPLRALLAAGADPNQSAQSELPLAVALQVERRSGPEPVRLLLEAGADPNRPDDFGRPAFFGATGHSSTPATLALLLDRGAEVNRQSRDGQTALLSASLTLNWAAARVLLERGADPDLGRNVNGQSFREVVMAQDPGTDTNLAAVRTLLERRP